jgi:hypothetical protein
MTSGNNQQIAAISAITYSSGSVLNLGGTYLFNTGTIDGGRVYARQLELDGAIGFLPVFVNVSNMTLTSSTTPAINANTYGRYYYITNSAFNTLILPGANYMGQHFIFRNATSTYLSVNVTYTGTGGGGVSTLTFPPLNTITIMYIGGGTGSGSAAYAFF